MPIYEFECRKCGEVFELFLQMNDTEDALQCPACKSSDLKKLVSHCGFTTRKRFKGELKPDDACSDLSCMPHKKPEKNPDYKPGMYLKKLPKYKDWF